MAVDLSRIDFADDFFDSIAPRMERAFTAMAALEQGAIANPDEGRMVGHYWLRNPALAPTAEIRTEIEDTILAIKEFAAAVHAGRLSGARGPFKNVLAIGIGGSALGPQFVAHALGHPTTDKMDLYFFDNTDPDGMDKVLSKIITQLGETLCIVTSKSGGTKETRNGMLEAAAAYKRAGLVFAQHAVAVTGRGSELDKIAINQKWLARFPMWDWIGGRTSQLAAVGLLPAALQGVDIESLLKGARDCDILTRKPTLFANPAALLTTAWLSTCNATVKKNMVVLPYKDRLELFSRYLQQLVMESLGKEKDLNGTVVHQGISVYGNKGSTDQHAYIQQLRDGVADFFVTFIEVLKDREGQSMFVDPDITSGDYLHGFLLGTRDALTENDRQSITLTIREVSPYLVGGLIALFERAVGLYASLVNINAYHQPGVEAGKKAAEAVISLQRKVLQYLAEKKGHALTASQIASGIGAHGEFERVFKICEYLAGNPIRGIRKQKAESPFEGTYELV